jgi:hypothetical protein
MLLSLMAMTFPGSLYAEPADRKTSIGVYYYPGWSPGGWSPRKVTNPWQVIKPYPEREPLLGWYRDGEMETVNQQLKWMADYGISFVVFDWYWKNGGPKLEHSVQAYLKAPARSRISYALLWANHNKAPASTEEWDKLVEYWLEHHLKNPEYLKIEGKPALFIFSGDVLRNQSKVIGLSTAEMLEKARQAAHKKGLAGIYFVLCLAATDYWVKEFAPRAGFDAISAYNYHFGVEGNADKRTPPSHSFDELNKSYQMQSKWILANTKLPYFVPMTSGWDMRPWGGSKDPLHDNSMSNPQEFEAHLTSGYKMITDNFAKTKGIGILCCWNEFGEGSFIEPTKRDGFEYLQRVRNIFGAHK